MRAYIAVTTVVFALITVGHIWRGTVERSLLSQPWYIGTTLLGAVLFAWVLLLLLAWGLLLLRRSPGAL